MIIRNFHTGLEMTGPEAERRKAKAMALADERAALGKALNIGLPRAEIDRIKGEIASLGVRIARIRGDLAPVRA